MKSNKTRKFLTAASALAGVILGSTSHAAAQSSPEVDSNPQMSKDERAQGSFVIAAQPKAQTMQDTTPNHQSHASHASHASHQSSYQ